LVFGSSAIKPQTPAGNRKDINIVKADSGWRPSENNKKYVDFLYFLGVGRGELEREPKSQVCQLRADRT